MRSWRLLASRAYVNGIEVDSSYADCFVVQREGDERPGPSDWEAQIISRAAQRLPPGTYQVRFETPDEQVLEGWALLRFSDGTRHLFRGDGDLGGFEP